jgi:hypothetical protein
MLAAFFQRWIEWKARPLLRIRYGSELDGLSNRQKCR